MSETYDIRAEQGATFSRALSYRDPSGQPIDLSGTTAALQVRPVAGDVGTPLLELTSAPGGGITLITPAVAPLFVNIELTADTAQMAAMTPGDYVYDLVLDFGQTTERLLEGAFSVSAEVTR